MGIDAAPAIPVVYAADRDVEAVFYTLRPLRLAVRIRALRGATAGKMAGFVKTRPNEPARQLQQLSAKAVAPGIVFACSY
jgi:hypothetical protein